MDFKYFLWCIIGLLLALSTRSYGQGPIYNFNFFNQATKDQDKPEQMAPTHPAADTNAATLAGDKATEAGPTPRTSFMQTQPDIYIFGSMMRAGHASLTNKQADDRDLYKQNRQAWVEEYNQSSHILSQQTEAGIGLPKMNSYFLETALVYKNMKYSLCPDEKIVGPVGSQELSNTYNGMAYGLKVGVKMPFNMSKSFDLILGTHAMALTGAIQYPSGNPENNKPKAKYFQAGMDVEAGVDFKLTKNITLGILGQYGRYDIKAKSRLITEPVPELVDGIIQKEKQQLGAGASLKIFI